MTELDAATLVLVEQRNELHLRVAKALSIVDEIACECLHHARRGICPKHELEDVLRGDK